MVRLFHSNWYWDLEVNIELWFEYLLRHGMPVVRPAEGEPFIEVSTTFYIPRTPPVDDRVWAFFILNHLHVIAQFSLNLEHHCHVWTEGLLNPPPASPIPPLREQQSVVFRRVPYLERLWSIFQDQSDLFTSSAVAELISETGPTAHTLLSAPEHLHL
jgi:hypothetical protein